MGFTKVEDGLTLVIAHQWLLGNENVFLQICGYQHVQNDTQRVDIGLTWRAIWIPLYFWRQIQFIEPAHFFYQAVIVDAIIHLSNGDVSDLHLYLSVVWAEALSAKDVLRVEPLEDNLLAVEMIKLGE